MGDDFTRYHLAERSFVAFAKKEIHHRALAAGFTDVLLGQIDIIVSELTSNLIKYAGAGELLFRATKGTETSKPVIEILCIDRGPGIQDTRAALKDGYSTKGTLGQGLGAIERLSSEFQIFSMPRWGTLIYSMKTTGTNTEVKQPRDVDVAALCVPKPPEEVCGDGFVVVETPSSIRILFGDGLGHGLHAREAVNAAVAVFSSTTDSDPGVVLRLIHEQVRRTRGLVACIAIFNRADREWSICGVGNISTRVYTGIEYRNYMSYNGTLGLNIPSSMKATRFTAERNQHLVMASDGIQSRWEINRYVSMLRHHQIVLAGALYKDFSRGTDDSSVLIAKVVS